MAERVLARAVAHVGFETRHYLDDLDVETLLFQISRENASFARAALRKVRGTSGQGPARSIRLIQRGF